MQKEKILFDSNGGSIASVDAEGKEKKRNSKARTAKQSFHDQMSIIPFFSLFLSDLIDQTLS
jgi:hypothetical protein